MELVIDIPKSLYANLQKIQNGSIAAKRILECVRNGKSVMYYPQVEGITPTVVEPNTDCVSRQYLVEKAVSWDKHFSDSERYVSLTDIQNALPVTPAEKVGRWIEDGEGFLYPYKCSNCGSVHDKLFNFCPSCGERKDLLEWEVKE